VVVKAQEAKLVMQHSKSYKTEHHEANWAVNDMHLFLLASEGCNTKALDLSWLGTEAEASRAALVALVRDKWEDMVCRGIYKAQLCKIARIKGQNKWLGHKLQEKNIYDKILIIEDWLSAVQRGVRNRIAEKEAFIAEQEAKKGPPNSS
jgi:hypothetical protein